MTAASSVRALVLLGPLSLSLAGCADRSPVAPLDAAAPSTAGFARTSSTPVERPIKGDCTTSFSFIDSATAGQCSVFQSVPSAFITIGGRCEIAHLGRADVSTVQQLVFLLDGTGQPVLIGGQPVVSQLRNCTTLTAANGDELAHTTIGNVSPGAGPADVSFSGTITFAGGTGRFSAASGSAPFSGFASLATNTGGFSFAGTVVY